ncbi:MAG: amino acid adenylation domain-containing protein, partial [Verrucomicrobia bacterium]|nr:amino acid adenylation domain-containing protein [Verrucomicrobiota bacterium]
RMVGHFIQLLESVCAHPDAAVSRLPILSNEERYRIVSEFNATKETLLAGSLGQLFDQQALARPETVAVEFEGRKWSYTELNHAATYWAAELFRHGIRPEDRVAVCMEPSFEMVVAVLAVIKAGATYVPLIPSYPDQRLGFILRDARVRLLLTQRDLQERLSQLGVLVICLNSDRLDTHPLQDPARIEPHHLAYIIYTSGSTGEPKGIEITHRAVLRLIRNTNYIDIRSDDRIALASNFAFDAATFELWGALLNGARIVGVQRDVALDPDRFARLLRDRGVTTLFLTTALFNQIARQRPDAFATLRHLMFGGEAVDTDVVRTILDSAPPARLLHVYGPTECTTFATWYEVRHVGSQDRTVPIGRPISNTRAYVVDENMELLPPGIPGELLLAGPGLARGYVNRPDLTASLFVPDPFSGEPGERLYRTGDLVRWRDNGEIEFLGRIDEQVKIRGFRIEPAEIAAALTRHPAVKEAAVVVREDVPGKKQLVGYAVAAPGERFSAAGLRAYLISRLPEYMIPGALVELPRLPLNANGKVDRKALPPPELSRESDRALEPPRNELEQALADAWRSVLGGRELGVNDNYFHLGGDSITAIQLISRLKQAGWELSVRDLFEHPTVRSLAPILRRREPRGEPSQKAVTGPVPLTPIQRWFFDEHAGDVHHFNQAVLLSSTERLDAAALRQVLQRLWEHHDALRMTYSFRGGDVSQTTGETGSLPGFELVDLQHEQDESASLQTHANRAQSSFDLEHGPLLKVVLFRLQKSDRLLVVIHHLAVDGVSWRIFLEDLQRGYAQSLSGKAVTFAPKTDSFQRWAQELQRFASSESVLADQTYWSNVVSQAAPAFPRDTDDAGPNLYGDSETVHTVLSHDETSRLLTESHQAYDTEVNDLLLTALGRALPTRPGNQHALITLEGHGRERLDVELDLSRSVGWFTCGHPFPLPTGEGDVGEQIRQVRQALRGVPNRGLSFGILRYLTPPHLAPSVRAPCRPQLSFNYLGQFDGGDDSALGFASESCGRAISPQLTRLYDLDVIGIVTAGRLSLSITFNPRHHRRGSVQQLLDAFRSQLLLVAEHCTHIPPRESASREFTFSQLLADDINRILRRFSDES